MLLKNAVNLVPPTSSDTNMERWRKVKLKVRFRPYWHFTLYSLAQPLRLLPVSSATLGPPKKLYETTVDWTKKARGSYQEIYLAHHFHPAKPATLDDAIATQFARLEHNYLPPAFVAEVPHGRIWGSNGSVISADDGLLADVSTEFITEHSKFIPDRHKHSIFRQFKLPPITRIKGTVAALSVGYGDVYYHWMLDLLPRIELMRRHNIDFNQVDKFVVNAIATKFQKETLALLGIPAAKIVESQKSDSFHIQADRLIVPSLPRQRGGCMPKWACDFLRNEFITDAANNYPRQERIYISRGDAKHRQVKDEAKLIDYLAKFGFKSVTLDAMSVVEQALLFSQAKVVIAPHGAGLTNVVFCSPNTKIVEFFSPNYIHPGYWRLSNQVGLDYYCLQGEKQPLPPGTRPKTDNISLNINTLASMMKLADIN